MDITPLLKANRQVIHSYGNGGFQCRDVRYDGSVIVLPEAVHTWPAKSLVELTLSHLEPLRAQNEAIELLLIGCGEKMAPIDRELRQAVREWGIVIEPMDTGAACRTYNVLLMEERRVAAALIAVD